MRQDSERGCAGEEEEDEERVGMPPRRWLSRRPGLVTAQQSSAAASSEELPCSRLGEGTSRSPRKIFSRSGQPQPLVGAPAIPVVISGTLRWRITGVREGA